MSTFLAQSDVTIDRLENLFRSYAMATRRVVASDGSYALNVQPDPKMGIFVVGLLDDDDPFLITIFSNLGFRQGVSLADKFMFINELNHNALGRFSMRERSPQAFMWEHQLPYDNGVVAEQVIFAIYMGIADIKRALQLDVHRLIA